MRQLREETIHTLDVIGQIVGGDDTPYARSTVDWHVNQRCAHTEESDMDALVTMYESLLETARERVDGELTPAAFEAAVESVGADEIAETLGGGSWEDALSVAGVTIEQGGADDDGGAAPDWVYDEQRIDPEARDDALQSAAAAMGEPLTRDDYAEWRESNPDAPGSSTITRRWGWSASCIAAGVEPGRQKGHTLDDLVAAVIRVRDSLGSWPTVPEYRDHRLAHEPSIPWFYKNKSDELQSWSDVVSAASDRNIPREEQS